MGKVAGKGVGIGASVSEGVGVGDDRGGSVTCMVGGRGGDVTCVVRGSGGVGDVWSTAAMAEAAGRE